MIEGKALAVAIGACADDKQAEDIVILDVRGISTITDYFVICTGTSRPHLRAIRNEIDTKIARENDVRVRAADGQAESEWLVLDYGDVIAHIFHEDKRSLYALEKLWADAPRVDWGQGKAEEARKGA